MLKLLILYTYVFLYLCKIQNFHIFRISINRLILFKFGVNVRKRHLVVNKTVKEEKGRKTESKHKNLSTKKIRHVSKILFLNVHLSLILENYREIYNYISVF